MNKHYLIAHRVSAYVYLNFNLNSDLCVCHHCDNPKCINPDHLFIGTRKDNNEDALKKGRAKGGSNQGLNHPNVKLREKDIIKIRNLYLTGKYYQKDLAKLFNIGQTHVSRIIRKEAWFCLG